MLMYSDTDSEIGYDYAVSFEYASDNLSSANSSDFDFVLFTDTVNAEIGDCFQFSLSFSGEYETAIAAVQVNQTAETCL